MGRIIYKNGQDLERMRHAGMILSTALAAMRDAVEPGISTKDLDDIAVRVIREHGATASFLKYRGYPASICSSVNEEVVHGIPNTRRVLKEGDLVKIDGGVKWKGFHADSAITVPVGKISPEAQRLIDVTRESLWEGIRAITYRGRLMDIAAAVQRHVESNGFSVVREMVGHGVGKYLHEEPQVPNYVSREAPNPPLLEGMTLAIEPMVNMGTAEIETLSDNWTVVTKDRKYSAHFEHTVAVTKRGFEILTLGPHDDGSDLRKKPAAREVVAVGAV